MQVEDLIEKLKEFDPNSKVLIEIQDGKEVGGDLKPKVVLDD